jgi:hypothetical protein
VVGHVYAIPPKVVVEAEFERIRLLPRVVTPVTLKVPPITELPKRVRLPPEESTLEGLKKFISPVEDDPRVRDCLLVVPRVPSPVKYVAILPDEADREAVGVPPDTLSIANLEDDEDVPPTAKSKVELEGERRLLFNCQ